MADCSILKRSSVKVWDTPNQYVISPSTVLYREARDICNDLKLVVAAHPWSATDVTQQVSILTRNLNLRLQVIDRRAIHPRSTYMESDVR